MNRKFLFGRFYSDKDIKDLMYSIMENKTPYEINKNTFITEIYTNEGTIDKSYNYFKNHTIPVEITKDKDLMYFNVTELINLMQSITTSRVSTKERIYYLTDAYLDWAVSKGYIQVNNMKGLSKDDLCKVNKRIASYRYTDIKTLDLCCESALESNNISVIDIMPLILSRYGILGKQMDRILNLRWDDIDDKERVVRIKEDDNVYTFEIDDIFLKWIKRAYETVVFEDNKYIDEGKVVKRLDKYPEINYMFIHNRMTKVFRETSMPRLSFKSLEFSRKIDLLLRIRETRVLTSADFRELTKSFDVGLSSASTNTLIKDYESLTGDKVQLARSRDKLKYVDNKPEKTVMQIKKTIGSI